MSEINQNVTRLLMSTVQQHFIAPVKAKNGARLTVLLNAWTLRPTQITAVTAEPSVLPVIHASTVSALDHRLLSARMVPARVIMYSFAETGRIVVASLEPPEPVFALMGPIVQVGSESSSKLLKIGQRVLLQAVS